MVKCEERSKTYYEKVQKEEILDKEVIGAKLRPESNIAMKRLYQLESFLIQLEIEFLDIG